MPIWQPAIYTRRIISPAEQRCDAVQHARLILDVNDESTLLHRHHDFPSDTDDGTKPAKLIASPIKLSGTPVRYRHAPPMLGQHTEEVLDEMLGMSADEVSALREKGVI